MANERIIERIRKMLALANDPGATEGERDNALRMAYATMAKYNIDMAEVETDEKEEERIDFENQSFSWKWARTVNSIIGELFFCKYYYGRKVNGTQCIHHFVGKESNAITAAVMADWIVKSILAEARKLYKQNTSPGARSFACGARDRLRERVYELRRAAQASHSEPGTGLALINVYKAEAEANESFLKSSGVELVKTRSRASHVDRDAHRAGHEFGGTINLSPQVEGKTCGRIR